VNRFPTVIEQSSVFEVPEPIILEILEC